MQYMNLGNFKFQLLFYFSIILVVIIGTLTHELSHYITARYLGYDAKISYSSVNYKSINDTNANHLSLIKKYNQSNTKNFDDLVIKISGPTQTILVSLIALLILELNLLVFTTQNLVKYQEIEDGINESANNSNILRYILILLTLFSLRQPVNLFTWILGYITTGQFSNSGDEYYISEYYGLPNYFILLSTSVVSIAILVRLIIKHIKNAYRITFLLIVFLGGISGYLLWIVYLGKYILR